VTVHVHPEQNRTEALLPDEQALAHFSAVVFKHADPRGFVSVRAFPHRDNTPAIFIDPITLGHPQFLEVVHERARQAATHREPAVFCPPVATFKSAKSATEENVLEGVTLAAELDESPNTARAKLVEWLGEPTLAMRSGGQWTDPETGEIEPKIHMHWRLGVPARTPEEIGLLKEARRLIVGLVGGDPTAAPVCHPLRWAGSVHTKGEPRLATIITVSENEIDLSEALKVLREEAGSTLFGSYDPQGAKEKRAANPEDVARALKVVPNENLKWDDWNYVGMAVWGAAGGSAEGFKAFAEWSAKASKNNPEETASRWEHYKTSPPKRIGFGTLVFLARKYSPGWTFTGANDAHRAGLPTIQIEDGELSSLATQGEDVLIAAGVPIYQRGGKLVRPIIETVDATRGRQTRVVQLKILDDVYLRDLLCRHSRWEKFNLRTKKLVPVNPPSEVAQTILARTGDWKFPAIAGVISAPTMRPDGSLLTEPGYDETTRLLLVEPPAMPEIPNKPTRDDALQALALLEALLTGFPFSDDVAKACALSAMITPVVRGAFPVTPMHASRAPAAASGKSFLWDVCAAIAIGQPMPVISTGGSPEETEKRLGSAFLAGQPLISIDNINGELGGDALCQLIERPTVDVRVLGRSESVRIEARGTSLFATGNNFVIVGDVCRRTVTTNLDPGVERPELRQFDFDPVDRVLADRGKYIAAALAICRAYCVAGRPKKAPKLASFEGWSDTVRSALMWLGKKDPVDSMEAARAEDPERTELRDMLEAWSAAIGIGKDTRKKLADVLLKGLSTSREHQGSELEPTYPDFHAALMAMALRSTGKNAQPEARMFGKWLQRFKGRIVDGQRFMCVVDAKRGNEWWVDAIQGER
jgi:hypothetical protein